MHGKPWTEEEDAFVIAKHKLRLPYPEIAGLLHMSGLSPSYRSRRAICGRVCRLGLAKPAVQKARHHAPQPAPVGTGRLSEISWARGPFPSVKACQWPDGDPREEDFRFCGAKAATGYSYCPNHCAIAYENWNGPKE